MADADLRAAADRISRAEDRLRALREQGLDVSALASQLDFARNALSSGQLTVVEAICDDVVSGATRLAGGGPSERRSTGRFSRDSGRFKVPSGIAPPPPPQNPRPASTQVRITPPTEIAPFQSELGRGLRDLLAGGELPRLLAESGAVTQVQLEARLAELRDGIGADLARTVANEAAQQLAARFRVVASAEQERIVGEMAGRLRNDLEERLGEKAADAARAVLAARPQAELLEPLLAAVREHLATTPQANADEALQRGLAELRTTLATDLAAAADRLRSELLDAMPETGHPVIDAEALRLEILQEVERRLGELHDDQDLVDDAAAEVERRLADRLPDPAAAQSAIIAAVDERWFPRIERLEEATAQLAARPAAAPAADPAIADLVPRLAAVETGLQLAQMAAAELASRPSADPAALAALEPRVASVEAGLDAAGERLREAIAAVHLDAAGLPQRIAELLDERLPDTVRDGLHAAVGPAVADALEARLGSDIAAAIQAQLSPAVESALAERLPPAVAAAVQSEVLRTVEPCVTAALAERLPQAVASAVHERLASTVERALAERLPQAIDLALSERPQPDPEALRRQVEEGLTGRIDRAVAAKAAVAASDAVTEGTDPVAAARAVVEERLAAMATANDQRLEADIEWRLEKLAAERGWCSLGDVESVVSQAVRAGGGSGPTPSFARLEAALAEFVRQTIQQQEQFIAALQQRFERGTALLLRQAGGTGAQVRRNTQLPSTPAQASAEPGHDSSSSLYPAASVSADPADAVDPDAIAAAAQALAGASTGSISGLTGAIAAALPVDVPQADLTAITAAVARPVTVAAEAEPADQQPGPAEALARQGEVQPATSLEALVAAEVARQLAAMPPVATDPGPFDIDDLVRASFDRRLGELSASRAAVRATAQPTTVAALPGEDDLRKALIRVLPTVIGEPAVAQRLFALIAMEAVSNPGALGELTGLRAFLRSELAVVRAEPAPAV
jgi:hypothetical protein